MSRVAGAARGWLERITAMKQVIAAIGATRACVPASSLTNDQFAQELGDWDDAGGALR